MYIPSFNDLNYGLQSKVKRLQLNIKGYMEDFPGCQSYFQNIPC